MRRGRGFNAFQPGRPEGGAEASRQGRSVNCGGDIAAD